MRRIFRVFEEVKFSIARPGAAYPNLKYLAKIRMARQ